MFADITKVFIL